MVRKIEQVTDDERLASLLRHREWCLCHNLDDELAAINAHMRGKGTPGPAIFAWAQAAGFEPQQFTPYDTATRPDFHDLLLEHGEDTYEELRNREHLCGAFLRDRVRREYPHLTRTEIDRAFTMAGFLLPDRVNPDVMVNGTYPTWDELAAKYGTCRHPDCPDTNWQGSDRMHLRGPRCPMSTLQPDDHTVTYGLKPGIAGSRLLRLPSFAEPGFNEWVERVHEMNPDVTHRIAPLNRKDNTMTTKQLSDIAPTITSLHKLRNREFILVNRVAATLGGHMALDVIDAARRAGLEPVYYEAGGPDVLDDIVVSTETVDRLKEREKICANNFIDLLCHELDVSPAAAREALTDAGFLIPTNITSDEPALAGYMERHPEPEGDVIVWEDNFVFKRRIKAIETAAIVTGPCPPSLAAGPWTSQMLRVADWIMGETH